MSWRLFLEGFAFHDYQQCLNLVMPKKLDFRFGPNRAVSIVNILLLAQAESPKLTSKTDESRLRRVISQIDEEDARSRYREEGADNNVVEDSPATSSQEEERKFVAWEANDPENPYNWSKVSTNYMLLSVVRNARCTKLYHRKERPLLCSPR